MKLTPMKIGVVAVGMIVVGAGLSLLAFLGGAKTNITFIDGEVILRDPFDIREISAQELAHSQDRNPINKVSSGGYVTIQENLKLITKLDVDVETLDVNIVAGENYALDINYRDITDVFYEVTGDTLTIIQEDPVQWKIFEKQGRKGEVTIYLPADAFIQELDIDMGFGSNNISDIQVGELDIECGMGNLELNNVFMNRAYIEGGMGAIKARDVESHGLEISMGMGSVDIQGDLKGVTDIEGGMGELKLTTKGKETDYNYDISKGMGTISINRKKHYGLEDFRENNHAANDIIIEGGMGTITVNTKE